MTPPQSSCSRASSRHDPRVDERPLVDSTGTTCAEDNDENDDDHGGEHDDHVEHDQPDHDDGHGDHGDGPRSAQDEG